jgi:predicted lipoprotein with Yx(FWY)xxD motif
VTTGRTSNPKPGPSRQSRSACGAWLSASVVLAGCVGYADGTGSPEDTDAADTASPDAAAPQPAAPDAAQQPIEDASAPPEDAGLAPDAAVVAAADVQLGYSLRFDGYLMDRQGQPLYMLADDVASAHTSACLADCAAQWPPFDLEGLEPGPGLLANEFTRFHRQDGDWQTAYKGHPLYRKAAEAGAAQVTGDGAEGRWFVARDYLAFLGRTSGFAPAGGTSFQALYLTNGFGRTLYVCFDDVAASVSAQPVSSCLGECALRRPLWSVTEAGRTSVLPSIMNASELGQFQRPDGALQLTYRGWPLYYFGGDEGPGDIQGHNQEAWRALDPVNFTGEAE